MDTQVGNKESLVDPVGSCCAVTVETDRRLKRRMDRKGRKKRVGGRGDAWLNNSC